MKTLILSCNTGEGHNSCAKAIKEVFDTNGTPCDIADALSFISQPASDFISGWHTRIYRHFPGAFRFGYRLTERSANTFREGALGYRYFARGAQRMSEFIAREQYEQVISVHVFSAVMMSASQRCCKLPISVSFVATDYTCSPGTQQSIMDHCFIPDDSLTNEYVCENIPREIISGCGVPIRQKFFQTTDPVQAKLQFGIAPEHRHLVVMGGSMGCGPIPSLTGALLRALPEDCEVTVVCGTNKTLLAALHRAHADIPRFHARGYVTDMPALLDSADLYLTKPGGLSTTEAAVRHLPMVLIDAVAGCEEHNMNFFVSTGGAKAARSVPMLTQLCVELLHNDAARQEMRDRLRERNFGNAALRIYEATVLQAGQ